MTEQELAELARRRARVYQALALTYAQPPDEQLLELFRQWGSLSQEFPSMPPRMKRGLRKLRVGSPPSPELLATLGTEFTRLLRGISRSYSPPPPYESVYRDGALYGPSAQKVAERYRRFHLHSKDNEPPDHLSLELDFMRFLCEREEQAWQEGNRGRDWLEEEAAFVNEHLARWVIAWCENMRRLATTDFYAGLADFTQGWVGCDQEIIRGLIEQLSTLSAMSRRQRPNSLSRKEALK